MSREIAFRDWVERTQSFLYWRNGITYSDPEFENRAYLEGVINWDKVQQYTGLTDKNGKRIFEGDVVLSHSDNGYHKGMHYKCIFYSGCFLFENTEVRWTPYELHEIDTPSLVGNIHDNPNLLNPKNNE